MKPKTLISLLLGTLLCTTTARGQGTFLWTWHGYSNFFQGSFEVTAADMDPNGSFTSQLFRDSLNFVAPDGYMFDSGQLGLQPYGRFLPGSNPIVDLDISFFNPITVRGLDVVATPQFGVAYLSGGWYEQGYWTYTATPEPTTASLVAVAAILWAAARSGRHYAPGSNLPRRLTKPLQLPN
jgi:hypothetical protein